jgi:uncharacterized OB-fold protein
MATPAQDRTLTAPVIYPDNTEFWAATAEGRLLVRHCEACGKPHWYPRTQCPLCMSDQVVWKTSTGQGSIYTFSVCRRVGPVPFAIAYVRLDDGVTMMSNIVDCDLDTIAIGQRVQVVFKEAEGGSKLPMFTPI